MIFAFSQLAGVFWAKFGHSLSKTPTKEARPAAARVPRRKMSLPFLDKNGPC